MNTGDKLAHPWPMDGKWIEFRWRKAVVCHVKPFYAANNIKLTVDDIKRFRLEEKQTWFLTVNNRLFHFYLGYQPIPVGRGDPGFYWQDLTSVQEYVKQGKLFVEPFWQSFRWGVGDIS